MPRNGYRAQVMIVVAAIVLRIAAVWMLQSHHVPRSTYEHGEIAANLLAGRGFSIRFLGADGPTSQQAPLYPFLVAASYAIGGVEQPTSLLILQVSQAFLGGLMVLGVMRLTQRASGSRPIMAWAAGLIAAVHPTLVYATTHVQVASLAAAILVWTIVLGMKTSESGRRSHAAATGALLSCLTLTDPILALVVLGILPAITCSARRQGRNWSESLGLSSTVVLIAVLGMSPWLVRNYLVHGEFVAIKSTFGYAFWQGNCALSEGTDKVVRPSVAMTLERGEGGKGLSGLNRTLWAARHEAGYLDDIALSREDRERLAAVSEPERSRILFRRAIRELGSEPGRYGRLCLRRLCYFWLFDETNPKTRVLAYRVSHLGLTALALIGLALARRDVLARLVPSLVTAATISLFHALTIVSARFHIPIEPLMAAWAAAGLSRWLPPLESHSATAGHNIIGVRFKRGLGRRERVGVLR